MSNHTATEIRRLLDADAALFLECGACASRTGASIDTAPAHLRGASDLHTLRVTTARADAANPESMGSLLDVVADAIVNEGDAGHLHFECATCGTENLTGPPTIGRLDDEERTRAVFLRGSTNTYPLPKRRPLRWQPPAFVCDACDCRADPTDILCEGPGAPEIGWTYAECPDCGKHYRPERVNAVATPPTP